MGGPWLAPCAPVRASAPLDFRTLCPIPGVRRNRCRKQASITAPALLLLLLCSCQDPKVNGGNAGGRLGGTSVIGDHRGGALNHLRTPSKLRVGTGIADPDPQQQFLQNLAGAGQPDAAAQIQATMDALALQVGSCAPRPQTQICCVCVLPHAVPLHTFAWCVQRVYVFVALRPGSC